MITRIPLIKKNYALAAELAATVSSPIAIWNMEHARPCMLTPEGDYVSIPENKKMNLAMIIDPTGLIEQGMNQGPTAAIMAMHKSNRYLRNIIKTDKHDAQTRRDVAHRIRRNRRAIDVLLNRHNQPVRLV